MDPALLDTEAAGRYLAICPRQVTKLRDEGRINSVRIYSSVRYVRSELDRFISELQLVLPPTPDSN